MTIELKIASVLIIGMLSSVSLASQKFPIESQPSDRQAPKKTYQGQLDSLLAPIKSKSDMINFISTEFSSPLENLSSNSKWSFIGSLVFGESGLASYRYDLLEQELTATEIHEILSLFGVQNTTPLIRGAEIRSEADMLIMKMPDLGETNSFFADDHPGFECVSHGTCGPRNGYICTSNC